MEQINNSKNVLKDVTIGDVHGNFHVGDVINLHFIDEASGKAFIKEYHNTKEDAERLRNEFKQELSEIQTFLKRRQEPILQQFAETIYNIAYIENAHFKGHGRVDIGQAGKVTIDSRMLTEKQKNRLEFLETLQIYYQEKLAKKMDYENGLFISFEPQYTKLGTSIEYSQIILDNYQEGQYTSFNNLYTDFAEKYKSLLIIGGQGSGKSVLLLNIAQKLIKNAIEQENYPIPIIIDLRTWLYKGQNFEDWLQQNIILMAGDIGISKNFIKDILNSNIQKLNFTVLLDGLDEVSNEDMDSCIWALSKYFREKENNNPNKYPIGAVCCRKKEYLDLKINFPIQAITEIAPIPLEIVINELSKKNIIASKIVLDIIYKHKDVILNEAYLTNVFDIHLILSISDYLLKDDFSINEISTEKLVDLYINQEINKIKEYDKNSSRKYLQFLAKKLRDEKKSLSFELLDIKTDWLKYPILFRMFKGFAIKISFGLFLGLLGSIIGVYITWNNGIAGKLWEELFLGLFFSFVNNIYGVSLGGILGGVLGWNIGEYSLVYINNLYQREVYKFNTNSVSVKKFISGLYKNFIYVFVFSLSIIFMLIMYIQIYIHTPFIISITISFILSPFLALIFTIIHSFVSLFFTVNKKQNIKKPMQKMFSPFLYYFVQWSISIITFAIIELIIIYYYGDIFLDFITVLETIRDALFFSVVLSFLLLPVIPYYLLLIQLSIEKKLPINIVRFLNIVSGSHATIGKKGKIIRPTQKGTGIMEKDGGQWRFRHQLIQDALAKEYKEK